VRTISRRCCAKPRVRRERSDSIDCAVGKQIDGHWYLVKMPDFINQDWQKRAIVAARAAGTQP
jgi:hypothetical protein